MYQVTYRIPDTAEWLPADGDLTHSQALSLAWRLASGNGYDVQVTREKGD